MTPLNSDLYDHPALYDALLPAATHVPYYVDLARRASGDVLELACGTGQLTVPIASAGVPTAGLDLSAPMLNGARERAAIANVSVDYVLGDMRNFDLGRRFALIFIGRNSSLPPFDRRSGHLRCGRRRHLAHGGIFAFDIFNPDVRMLARPSGSALSGLSKRNGSVRSAYR